MQVSQVQVSAQPEQTYTFPGAQYWRDRTAEKIELYQFLVGEAIESATDYYLDALQTDQSANKMKDPQFAHLLHQHAKQLRKSARRAAARAHRWNESISKVSAV